MVNTPVLSTPELWARGIQALLAVGLAVFALPSSGLSVVSHLPSAMLLLVVAALAFFYTVALLRGAVMRDSPVVLDRMYAALLLVVGAYFTYKMWDNWGCKHEKLLKFKCGHVNNASVIYAAIWILVTVLAFLATSLKCFRDYAAASTSAEAPPATYEDGAHVGSEASVV